MNWFFAASAAGLALGLGLACNSNDGSAGGSCVPNQQVYCYCPGDPTTTPSGIQVCNAAGVYDVCQCGGATSAPAETDTDEDDSQSGSTTGDAARCGDGHSDPGECDPDGVDHACPEDCGAATSSSGGEESTTSVDACAGVPIYVGMVPGIEPPWEHMGVTGFGAGTMMCQGQVGADDVCTYEMLVDAEAQGDLAGVPAGTTMWVHREQSTTYNGVMIPAGATARCNDWLYDTNHLHDGEYVTVGAVGALTFTLDPDVTTPADGLLQCAGETRAIPCCDICE
jgi:hypothetical protein